MLKVKIDSFSYAEKTILNDIEFAVKPGEHLSILGESGSGKSTLLHLIYGLIHLENGSIFYRNKKLLGPNNSLIPGEPFMKLVAQEFNIMPFTTVAENLGSHLLGLEAEKDAQRIDELLQVVEMTDFKNTLVKNLSGGQKQRVALAKALANEPELLLLDEPFSNIDAFMKNRLRRKLFRHLKEKKISCISATHDSEEALAFSDHILMMKDGEIEMFGTPEEVYKNASAEYQAGFFDDVNMLPKYKFFSKSTSEEIVVFPHQLQLSSVETNFKVLIQKSYFKGNHYLIESIWETKSVFFKHLKRLDNNSIVWLKYSQDSTL